MAWDGTGGREGKGMGHGRAMKTMERARRGMALVAWLPFHNGARAKREHFHLAF